MIEREMQELLWRYPERFLNEQLKPFAWEMSSEVGRADLVFEDRHGRLLIVEVKLGKLPRGAIDQLLDYFGMLKSKYPDKPIELMVVANIIPGERRLTCESRDIECREISERLFRVIAAEVGYSFVSEAKSPLEIAGSHPSSAHLSSGAKRSNSTWSIGVAGPSLASKQDFLSRCDERGKLFFSALLDALESAAQHARVTWEHESGFSVQFRFDRVGFAPIVWGFPSTNREGKSIRQRIEFPFDFSIRAGVSERFINEFAGSMASLVPLSGGRKRPSINISELSAEQDSNVITTVLAFAERASIRMQM